MGVTAKSLGIDKLDVENRLALIGELWDSVSSDTEDSVSSDTEELPLSPEFKAELDRRVEEADANPEIGTDWERAKTDTMARLQK